MIKLYYYKIYKPYGMLSQFTDSQHRDTLQNLYNFPKEVYSLGRLDSDSEGLLLLSNDKKLNKFLLGPFSSAEKEYLVQVEGKPGNEELLPLKKGVMIENKITLPAEVEIIEDPQFRERIPPVRMRKTVPDSWIKITIREGRNRQVRKMTAKIGFPTLRLVRVRIKNILLDKMEPGEVKELTQEEIKGLLL